MVSLVMIILGVILIAVSVPLSAGGFVAGVSAKAVKAVDKVARFRQRRHRDLASRAKKAGEQEVGTAIAVGQGVGKLARGASYAALRVTRLALRTLGKVLRAIGSILVGGGAIVIVVMITTVALLVAAMGGTLTVLGDMSSSGVSAGTVAVQQQQAQSGAINGTAVQRFLDCAGKIVALEGHEKLIYHGTCGKTCNQQLGNFPITIMGDSIADLRPDCTGLVWGAMALYYNVYIAQSEEEKVAHQNAPGSAEMIKFTCITDAFGDIWTMTDVTNMPADQIKAMVQPGDVTCAWFTYTDAKDVTHNVHHAQIYAGKNGEGKDIWYNWGGTKTITPGTAIESTYWDTFAGYPVGSKRIIMRLK